MSDATFPTFPIFAFLGFIIALVPIPWHLQAWNSGTCLYMVWTAVACLNQFINSFVWHGNAVDHAPVWCDISTRFMIGTAVAIPAASLCINRRLYRIISIQTVSITRQEKQKAILIDMLIGIGVPVVQMSLQYIVQGHRYNIYEDIGCFPATYNTPPAYPLVFVWPTAIGLISAVYCVLTLRAFIKRRAQFSQLLSSHNSLTVNRYFRLMALASTDLLCTVPYSAYGVYLNATNTPLFPWISWEDTHFNFSRVELIPSVNWRLNHSFAVSLELSRWLLPVCAIMFFAFFGFADEARKNYYKLYRYCAQILPRISASKQPLSHRGISGSLPLYRPRSFRSDHSSLSSTPSPVDEKTLSL